MRAELVDEAEAAEDGDALGDREGREERPAPSSSSAMAAAEEAEAGAAWAARPRSSQTDNTGTSVLDSR